MKSAKALLAELVAIDSPSGEELAVSQFVFQYLTNIGGMPYVDNNNMVYCRFGSGAPKLFCAHLDTVEPGRGITLIEREGYYCSRGDTILGADNKVAVAAILTAVTNLVRSGKTPNIELLFTVEEETISGVRRFDISRLYATLGYVFDVGNGDLSAVVQSAPFIFDFTITINGKAAHASYPHLGKNALIATTTLLSQLPIGQADAWSTLNIGLISGGSATNSVPAQVVCCGDLRSTQKECFERLKQRLEVAARSVGSQSGCVIDVAWMPYAVGYNLGFDTPAYDQLRHIYENKGLQLTPWNTTSGSDAGFLNSVGIETYCLGDGVEDAHTVKERVSEKKLSQLVDIIECLMQG